MLLDPPGMLAQLFPAGLFVGDLLRLQIVGHGRLGVHHDAAAPGKPHHHVGTAIAHALLQGEIHPVFHAGQFRQALQLDLRPTATLLRSGPQGVAELAGFFLQFLVHLRDLRQVRPSNRSRPLRVCPSNSRTCLLMVCNA